MRVVHLAPSRASDSSAAWRLVNAQRENGIDAFSLVYTKPKGRDTLTIFRSKFISTSVLKVYRILNSGVRKILYRKLLLHDLPWSIDLFGKHLARRIQSINPDIIHLHWIPSMVDLKSFKELNIPIVLTLHDVWPITGGCHCNLDCDSWKSGCTSCPQIISRIPAIYSPEQQWNAQKKSFSDIKNFTVICPSKWILEMARSSPKFVSSECAYIPNCIEIEGNLNLESRSKADVFQLAYVASGERNSYHKGQDLLIDILKLIDSKSSEKKFSLSIIGGEMQEIEFSNIEVTFIPFVSLSNQMFEYLYQADLLLLPSRQDNLPNVAIEANLVGTPVIAFNVGGIGDIVENGISGELVEKFNKADFANKVIDTSSGNLVFSSRVEIQRRTRDKFGATEIARQHLEIYNRLVKN